MIAMLIGCGLRRAELLALRLESIQRREEHWVVADLVGKAGHVRTVPVPTWVKAAVDAWTAAAAITDGPVFRAVNKAGRIWGDGMSPKVLWDAVRAPRLAPTSTSLPHTTCDVPARVFAILPAANWIKSTSCSATARSRRPSVTLDPSRNSELP